MDFEPGLQPPLHIPLAFGSIRARKQKPKDVEEEQEEKGADICLLCQGTVKVKLMALYSKAVQWPPILVLESIEDAGFCSKPASKHLI